MSLAEELLADLEDQDATEEAFQAELAQGDEIEEIDEDAAMEAIDEMAFVKAERIGAVARLAESARYKETIKRINEGSSKEPHLSSGGPIEADPEYRLIVDANALAVDIDNEINGIHKFVRDRYSKRFPELESLVPMPMDYICSVRELGNDILDKAKNNENLQRILLPATVIVVSVTASTTQGELLSDEELEAINEACDLAVDLNMSRQYIFEFVETRMSTIAPNLSAVVGSTCAAKLMGVAGGIAQLSRMPSANVLVLGSQKRTLAGFSSTAVTPHTGFVFYTPLVQSLPPDLRRKAARVLANKCTLAARVDANKSDPGGENGRKFFEEVRQKYEKMQEPPPVKQVKPLPKPIDEPSKKRGGRRLRKMKERLGMTEMRRKANRMNFGELEEDVLQEDLGFSLGQMKTKSDGRIRKAQVDDKSRARMSKALQKSIAQRSAGIHTSAGGVTSVRKGQVSGTASSVNFTPVQGIEIVNPNAIEREDGTKSTYFSSTAGFVRTPIV